MIVKDVQLVSWGMGTSIILDPLDVHRLCAELGKSLEEFASEKYRVKSCGWCDSSESKNVR